jgi:hypothetical protein
MSMTAPKRDRVLNDIRYFDCTYLPTRDLASPAYMGELFTAPPASVAFGQLIGGKCQEARLGIRGGSALYLMFTSALPDGAMQRLDFRTEVWQTWMAYGLSADFNGLAPDAQFQRLREATFRALNQLAPERADALRDIEGQYAQHGDRLRVRCLEKSVRGHRCAVSHEVRPIREVSRLWLEVTELKTGRYAEVVLASLRDADHGAFLAHRLVVAGESVVVHPRVSDRADYYTQGYATPFSVGIKTLFPDPE